MKAFISVVFLSALAGSYAFIGGRTDFKNADKDILLKQKALFELLQHPYQPGVSIFKQDYLNLVNAFDFEQNYGNFRNVEAVKEFYRMYKKGLMPFNELFSIYNQNHRRQAIALFHVFYYAKDWDTFYKTMLWARFNVNPGLFIYSLNVAIIHRKDFAGLGMPAIYEIFPQYFFNFDVIQRAQMYKQQGFPGVKKVDGAYNLVLQANYSSYDVYSYEDQQLSYFTEDIGLNAYYYYFHIDYPFWMGGEEYGLYKDRRGEYFFWFHQQLMTRYYLERLSNHMMGPVKDFTWWTPIQGYYPNIRTYSGYPFMSRDKGHVIYQEYNHYDVDFIYAYENRLLDAIDSGLFLMENGTYFNFSYPGGLEYLGNLVQGNPDSLNYKYYNYMSYVFKTFGKYYGKYNQYQSTVFPSVLQQPETMLRDPAYWGFMKRFLMFYYKFQGNLRPYTYQEINYDGVKIETVDVDKLTTYFDYFDADITNAVDVEYPTEGSSEFKNFGRVSQYRGEDFIIKARQWRLNHMPFKVNVKIESNKAQPAVVRFFLGAKYDEAGRTLKSTQSSYTFYLMDMFKYDLVSGTNMITRDSTQFFFQVKDRTTYYDLYKYVMLASTGAKTFPMDNTEAHSGFPNRLLLPKGKKNGMTYKLFVHVAPYYAPNIQQYSTFDPIVSVGIGSGSRYIDAMPFGYPLDRRIDEFVWDTPNMYYQDVTIFHKTQSEINSPEYQ